MIIANFNSQIEVLKPHPGLDLLAFGRREHKLVRQHPRRRRADPAHDPLFWRLYQGVAQAAGEESVTIVYEVGDADPA